MLKKLLRAGIALALVAALSVQAMPIEAFAVALESGQQSSGAVASTSSGVDTDAALEYVDVFAGSEPTATGRELVDSDIVCEVEERRDEYTKHYRLVDSSMVAAVYDIPIHEKDSSGAWVEIDNSLTRKQNDTGEVLYVRESGSDRISLAGDADSARLLSIETGYGTINWGFATLSSSQWNADVVSQKSVSYIAPEVEADREKLTVKSVGGIVRYDGMLPGVSLTYQLVGHDIKENIVLETAAAAQSFDFLLQCTGGMTAELSDNQIAIYSKDGELVRLIAAPYMIDSNDRLSDDVTLSISGRNGNYTVTVTPDMDWLLDEARVYPVIIDPTITNTYTNASIDNTSVNSVSPNSSAMYQYGCVYVGRESSTYGNLRGVVKFTLPTQITESDMIIDAYVKLTQRNYFDSGTITANMHKITEELSLSSMTWNTLNGKYDSTVLDSMIISSSTKETHVKWDITAAVKSWYLNGDNYGLALVSENEGGTYKYAIFYTARYPNVSAAKLPSATITYLNHDGIEDYLSYHYAGSSTMGSLAVGDFNGNLIYSFEDVSTTGNYLPISISHVYNHSRRDENNLAGGNMYYGNGMRLNVSQRIEAAGISGYTYKYTDEDGTVHYFSQSSENSSVHEKEFDSTTTITVNSDGSFTLSNSGDLSYSFSSAGYLTGISDASNGKSVTLSYTGEKLTAVTDGAGRSITLSYNSSNYLSSITDPAGRSTTYSYSNGCLVQITRPDSTVVTLNYTPDGDCYILSEIEDIDGSAVAIEYNAASPRRVSRLTEYGTGGTAGNMLTWSYTAGETTISDRSGKSETMMFDNSGHTVCIRDGEGNAVYGSYVNTTDNNKNSLSYQSQLQSSVTNYLTNHGFEGSSLSPWTNYLVSATGTLSQDATTVHSGNKSAKIESTSTTGRVGYQGAAVVPGSIGSTVTVSAYVKITDIETIDEDYSGFFLGIIYQRADGVWATDASPSYKATTDWQRMSHTFQIPSDAISETVKMSIAFNCAQGTAYVDDAQLELGAVANRYNLLDNGHFCETAGSTSAASWYRGNLSDTTDVIVSGRSGNGIKMVGDRSTSKFLEQTVYYNGSAGDCFVFGGWVKADALAKTDKSGGANRDCAIRLYFLDEDGNYVGHKYFNFEAKSPNWQYLSGSITAPCDYTAVRFAVLYYNQKNSAIFDDLQLYRESFGQRLEYDDYGRLISSTDSMERTTTYSYAADNRSELSQITYSDGSTTTYTYDTSNWRLLTVTDSNGKVTTYHYDANGNCTEATMAADGEIISSGVLSYDSLGQISTATDSRGNTTSYEYNAQTGLLESTTDAKGTETEYCYNTANDYLLGVESSGSGVEYEYTYGKLVSISHYINGNDIVSYTLVYDEFGNSISTKVGTQALISHQYAANNGLLTRSTYGNGDYYEPGYDELDRLVSASYNGVELYNWDYGADGRIGLHNDLVNDVQWRYEYTLGGDLTSVSGSNGERFSYAYDTASGKLIGFTASDGATEKTTTYVYGEQLNDNKNLIESVVLPTGTIDYDYDSFYRTSHGIKVNGSEILSTDYTFLDGVEENSSTVVVGSVANAGNGWLQAQSYTYDANGNIETISENGVQLARYYYDELNQLIREDNAQLGKTIVYEYDYGGNILLVKEYPYTTGSLDDVTTSSSQAYSYGDSNWKDKLTSYNGNAITYDEIGNPLSYYNGLEFEWQNGRQLASVSGSDLEISYKYNADGVRTSKTVNGVTTTYTLNGINVVKETDGETTIWYYYDPSGSPVSFELNGTAYFYVKNLQGDIVAITDASGNKVVEYVYDSWGKLVSITGSLADTVGVKNPYRYRGYRYDTETGLYYLNSRYYDPAVKRFVNADGFVSTGQGILGNNMFAYCNNDPVNFADYDGNWPKLSTVCTVVAITAVAVAAVAIVVLTAGAAIPALAVVGGGIISVGTATTAATIATAALVTAGIATTAAIVANIVENTNYTGPKRDNSVYIMRDQITNEVQYVGRTNNPIRRQNEHLKDPRKSNLQPLEVKFSGLTKDEARIVEQLLISAYSLDNLVNARREIATGNLKGCYGKFGNITRLFIGAAEDELLNLMGR